MTQDPQVVEIYAAWVAWTAISAIVLWVLAKWSTKRQLHVSALVVAAVVSLICLALLAYAFSGAATGPINTHRTSLQLLLADRAPPLLLSFLVWPLVACIALAQLSRRLTIGPRVTHWVSFTVSVVISCISLPAILMAGCRLAGACL